MRRAMYINCWRAGSGESIAMWDLYGKGSGFVAVKTTLGKLKAQLDSSGHSVFLARVNYLDWDTAPGDEGNAFAMYTRKDLCYAHEAEVRAIIWGILSFREKYEADGDYVHGFGPPMMDGPDAPPTGLSLEINPSTLVTEVIVGPREKPWVAKLVQDVLRRYELVIPVRSSNRLTAR